MSILTIAKNDRYELIDLAQIVMDGSKDGVTTAAVKTGGNRAAEMMKGLPPEPCALLWALVRSSEPDDRHFSLLHCFLTSEIRLLILDAGIKFTKQNPKDVAKGIARTVLTQYLFNKGKCQNCKGKGFVQVKYQNVLVKCDPCDGNGRGHYTQSERFMLTNLNIARKSYIQTCEQFEQPAMDIVHSWRFILDSYLSVYFNRR